MSALCGISTWKIVFPNIGMLFTEKFGCARDIVAITLRESLSQVTDSYMRERLSIEIFKDSGDH